MWHTADIADAGGGRGPFGAEGRGASRVPVPATPRPAGRNLIVVVGGAGDGLGGLAAALRARHPGADVAVFPPDREDEAAALVDRHHAAHPAAEIELVGHGDGGVAALAVAALLDRPNGGVPIRRVITLDPSAATDSGCGLGSRRPGNVRHWVHVYVEGGSRAGGDGAGGRWGYERGADVNVPVPPCRPGGQPALDLYVEARRHTRSDPLSAPGTRRPRRPGPAAGMPAVQGP